MHKVYSVLPAVDKRIRINLMGKDRFDKLIELSTENIGIKEKRKRWSLSNELSKEENEQFISQLFDYCTAELYQISRACETDQWYETSFEREHLSKLYYIAGRSL